MAIINTVIGTPPHVPPNQWLTTLYQSNVYGANINPKMGQTKVLKIPVNQWVKNHSNKIANRGKKILASVIIIGMGLFVITCASLP